MLPKQQITATPDGTDSVNLKSSRRAARVTLVENVSVPGQIARLTFYSFRFHMLSTGTSASLINKVMTVSRGVEAETTSSA